jgi:hypothetical protein
MRHCRVEHVASIAIRSSGDAMAKTAKKKKTARPVQVKDLRAKKNPKGGVTSRKSGEGQKDF